MATDGSQHDRKHGAKRPKANRRVDRAHARDSDPPAAAETLAAAAEATLPTQTPVDAPVGAPLLLEATPAATGGQVRLQASQLAAQLQRQQATIDHREAELNARVAAMENQIRAARLWLDERQADLVQREAALENRPATQAVAMNDQALAARSAELDRREAELQAAQARLGQRFGTSEAGGTATESFEAQRAQLEQAEKLLAVAQGEWQQKYRDLAEQRAAFTAHVETERQKLTEERRRWASAYEQDHRELKRQEAELANRMGALQALRAEVNRTQQETLENRLATEELWAQLSGRTPPASMAQSLGQIRLRLTEEFRIAKTELAAERAQIKQLAERLSQQHQAAAEKRQQSQTWLSGRLRELDQFTSRLADRERQLDERQTALEAEKQQWQAERLRLEQELRRLLRGGHGRPSANAA